MIDYDIITMTPAAKVVQAEMEERCWIPEQLAIAAGLSKQTIYNILKGYPSTERTIKKLAVALKRPVDDFYNEAAAAEPKRVVYIAGAVTGQPDRNSKAFTLAHMKLAARGYIVLNPTRAIPEDMPERGAMEICLAMLEQADAIYMLPGWESSTGASVEYAYAMRRGLKEVLPEEL